MPKLVWDQAMYNRYEAGVDRGVFYPKNGPGVVWNGLTSVGESPSGSDDTPQYLDGVKIRTRSKLGDFAGQIEAFTYPEELYYDAVTRQRQVDFGFAYRVMTNEAGDYQLHLVYNVLLGPESHVYQYEETSPFSWDFTTTPVAMPGRRPSAHLIVDSETAIPQALQDLEDVLYGSNDAEARLPLPAEIFDMFEAYAILRITDNQDGTWTANGPDDVVTVLDSKKFQVAYDSVTYQTPDSYSVHSL